MGAPVDVEVGVVDEVVADGLVIPKLNFKVPLPDAGVEDDCAAGAEVLGAAAVDDVVLGVPKLNADWEPLVEGAATALVTSASLGASLLKPPKRERSEPPDTVEGCSAGFCCWAAPKGEGAAAPLEGPKPNKDFGASCWEGVAVGLGWAPKENVGLPGSGCDVGAAVGEGILAPVLLAAPSMLKPAEGAGVGAAAGVEAF